MTKLSSQRKLQEVLKQHGHDPEKQKETIPLTEDTSITVKVKINSEVSEEEKRAYKMSLRRLRNSKLYPQKELLLLDYLRIEELVFVDKNNLNPNEVIYQNSHLDIYHTYISNINLKLADDQQNIFNNQENLFSIYNSLKPLLKIVLGSEYENRDSVIYDLKNNFNERKKIKIEKEKIETEIKYSITYLISKATIIINEFLIKPQFSLEEFEKLINTTKKPDADKLTLVEKIDTSDIKPILEGISRIFPELKISFEVNFESPITNELNYMVGGSAITSGCKALRGKDNWGKSISGKAIHIHKKSTAPDCYIYHYINDFKNQDEINFLPYSEAEQILDKFGVYPALLHLILAVHFYRQPNPLTTVFHLRGTDLIKDLGLHKRTDLSIHEKLSKVLEIVTAVRSLIITAKWSSEIKKKSGRGYKTQKVNISVEPSIMWDISPKLTTQKDLFGNEEITEIDIVCKSGAFLGHFFDEAGYQMGKSLYNFATQSQKILDLDPFHEELALRIALLQCTMDYRQYYTVEAWLNENLQGAKDRISKAKKDQPTRKNLTSLWDKTLLALERIGYTIHYDERTYPHELRPTSPRKPRGYFERLLEAKIKLQPETLGKPQSEIEAKETEAIEVKPLPQPQPQTYSGKKLKEARLKANVTPKQLAKYLKCSQGKIYNAEKRENLSKQLFKEIMDAINFVKNHPDKF